MSNAANNTHNACIITSRLQDFFAQQSESPIIVAYSGGVDSQVLVHALSAIQKSHQLTNQLMACHVNHGLSEHAALWAKSAEEFCNGLNVEINVTNVVIDVNSSNSLEALARDARYNALSNVETERSMIVTGHHSDDQSETFLLALKRGAGIKGLSAMSESMTLGKHTLVRPLLTISRKEILAYANKHQLSWHEDESNQDQRFDRNFLRNTVIPALKERWPSISTTINRSAEHCSEAQQLLDEVARDDLATCIVKPEISSIVKLSVSSLLALSVIRFNNTIRYFLQSHEKLMPSVQQLKQLHQQLSSEPDKTPAIKINDYWLRRFKGQLYLTEDFADVKTWESSVSLKALFSDETQNQKRVDIELPDNLGTLIISPSDEKEVFSITLSHGATLSETIKEHQLANLNESEELVVKFSHNNPVCLPDYRQKSRPLKKVLQELNIPTWERNRVPFLYRGDELIAAIGYFTCKAFVKGS